MFYNVYTHSSELDAELRVVEEAVISQLRSGNPDMGEVNRLYRRRARLKSRYIFDWTMPANWMVFLVGCVALTAMVPLLRAIH